MAAASSRAISVSVPTGETTLAETLESFAAGREVPGSGSANALVGSVAAALTASVATKTFERAGTLEYRAISDTARRIAARASTLSRELLELFEQDATAFGKVVSIRREAKSLREEYEADQSLRREIAAMKRATEIPLEIAEITLEITEHAGLMVERGFRTARGESYSALVLALAATDGAIYIAQLNIRDVKKKVEKLNDPGYERPWLKRMNRRVKELAKRYVNSNSERHTLPLARAGRARCRFRRPVDGLRFWAARRGAQA